MMWSSSSCSCSRLLPTTTAAALLLPSTAAAAAASPPLLRLRGRPPRLRLAASASSSYNGWGELPDFSFPLLLLPHKKKKKGLLVLLLLAIPASAVALSRLPPLPLLAAAFTAGFAARHLSFPQPSALTLVLADLDAQVRALRDHLASSSSNSQPLLHVVDRLRDAVHHATGLAHQGTTPTLAPMGDLADSLAAWARDAMRDLSTTSSKPKDLGDPKVSPIQFDAHNKPPGSAVPGEDMLPFHDDALEDATTRTSWTSNLELERLRLKHKCSRDSSNLLEKRIIENRDRLQIVREAQEQVDARLAGLDHLYHDGASDSDCQDLSRSMKEAAEILKKARECMMARADEETADALLYKSARLLSTAVALRPTSLVAVGQLGNTYLLHGELKLKISRELRMLLADTIAPSNGRERVPRYRKVDRRILSRDNVSAALVDVCEECENLLVEAGRSYRTVLTIDSGDVKALYNWGLALIFRAQLLADIGPEAAVDADRVYLAAIDKFDAMLSKSNTYAPEALYRWGTALQQRSHLRPQNNREKIRLLEQAKSLFEDVLYVEADNKMVREALSSCISELNYHGRWI